MAYRIIDGKIVNSEGITGMQGKNYNAATSVLDGKATNGIADFATSSNSKEFGVPKAPTTPQYGLDNSNGLIAKSKNNNYGIADVNDSVSDLEFENAIAMDAKNEMAADLTENLDGGYSMSADGKIAGITKDSKGQFFSGKDGGITLGDTMSIANLGMGLVSMNQQKHAQKDNMRIAKEQLAMDKEDRATRKNARAAIAKVF